VTRPGSLRAWLLACRPRTLPASAAPVILGVAVAAVTGPVRSDLAAACLTVAVVLQVAANLANDYFDARSGVDGSDRLGPVRATQAGLLRSGQVLAGLIVCLTLGAVAGLFIAWQAGWWVLGLGGACLLGAVAYTAGPWPLARQGLGELAALVFFGPVACTGTYAVLAGPPSPVAWAAGLVPGLHAAALMGVNNLRDMASDRRAGKRTLAIRLGERQTRLLVVALLLSGNLAIVPVAVGSRQPLALAALILVPLSLPLLQSVLHTPVSPALNRVLSRTGQWELVTCLVLAVGLTLSLVV
jgi:1,4-dihydroxy-2-naphthoate octaprenyltransferase